MTSYSARLLTTCLACGLLNFAIGNAGAEDWTRFRGPGGQATSHAPGLPVHWSARENVVWKTELPGLGTSSPITLGDSIFLTCYSGYGLDPEAPGKMDDLMRHVVCLDRNSGDIVWTRAVKPRLPESEYSGGNNSWHGYSSSTPTTDGERLYVFFGKSGVFCFDLDGKQIWQADVGDNTHGWGSANSPILAGDLLIVNASVESNSLVALDKRTGEEVWRAGGIRGSRNTPVLVEAPNGRTELVLSAPEKILAFDPTSGKALWSCEGIPDRGYVCPSVIAHDGIVYVIGGRKNTALAVRAGGRGNVTETHVLWRTAKGSNVTSPVYHDGYLFWVHERNGIAFCLDAKTGKLVYEERLRNPRPGIIYSSALVADGKLYYVSQHNGTYVLAANPEFELLAHNDFENDDSRTNASPVVSDGKLLLRNDRYLYCIGSSGS